MRVLHVVGNLDATTGGSTAAAVETCGHLRRIEVDAQVAGTWACAESADYITVAWPGLPVHGFARRPPRHYWHSPAMRRWLNSSSQRFDLVCVHGLFKFPFVDAAAAARRAGVPCVVQPHGSLDPYDLRKHRPQKAVFGPLVVRRMLQNAAGVLVTTTRERERLHTWGARPPVEVLPLPVSAPAEQGSRERFRREHGIDDDAPVLLFLSRIHPKKRLDRLFEAAGALRDRYPSLVLAVAGSGKRAHEEPFRRAESAAGGARVLWLGLLGGRAKWDAFAGADVFVLPSDFENFGIVVLEAMTAGTPAVITDQVFLADDLGDSGVEICAPDARAVATAVDGLLADPARARHRAGRAQAVARERYSPEAVTAQTLAFYDAVLARAGDRASRHTG